MYKINLIVSSLLLFPIIMAAQIFPKEGDDVGSLVTENYILKDVNFGDLNGDAQDDLVIVIRDKKTKIKSAAIYYAGSYSWDLISESESFFLLENTDIFDPGLEISVNRLVNEEYVNISIKNQVITISTTDGYGNSIDANFRKNQIGNYELIGIEIGSYSMNVEKEKSINYLTDKMQIKFTSVGGIKDGEIHDEWFKVLNLRKVYFDNFSVKNIYSDIDQLKFEKI